MRDARLLPAPDAVTAHLAVLVAAAVEARADGQIEVAYTRAGDAAPSLARLFGLDEIDEAANFAIEKNDLGADVYVGGTLRAPGAARDRRSSGADFRAALFAVVDIDRDVEAVRARLEAAGLRPAIRVRTGATPSPRLQYWFRLAEPCADFDAFAEASRALVLHVGGDPKAKDVARLYRLAGTVNWAASNNPRKRDAGYADEPTLLHVEAGAPRVSLARLAALPPIEGAARDRAPGGARDGGEDGIARDRYDRVVDGRESYFRQTTLAVLREFQEERRRDPSVEELFSIAFDQWEAQTLNEDGRWTSPEGRRQLRRRVVNTLRRLRAGDLERDGLYALGDEPDETDAPGGAGDDDGSENGSGRDEPPAGEAARAAPAGPAAFETPAPPFDPRILGPVDPFARALAAALRTPADYAAAPLLAAAGGLAAGARLVFIRPGWEEVAAVWCCAVGRPGQKKSPAQRLLASSIHALQRALNEDFADRLAEHREKEDLDRAKLERWRRELKDAVSSDGRPPERPEVDDELRPPRRVALLVDDATVEALAPLIAAQPARVACVWPDELSGWIRSFERYKTGSDVHFWLRSYDGGPYTVDRVKLEGRAIHIPRLVLGVCGGATPEVFASTVTGREDDGLVQRLLLFAPDRPDWDEAPPELPSMAPWERAVERLAGLEPDRDADGLPRPRAIPLSREARALLEAFERRAGDRAWASVGKLAGFLSKLHGHAARVACALAHLDWAFGPDAPPPVEIGVAHVERALLFAESYAIPMADRVYGAASAKAAEEAALNGMSPDARLLQVIRRIGKSEITVRDVQRREAPGLTRAKEVREALLGLAEDGLLACLRRRGRGGPREVFRLVGGEEGSR